MRSFDPRTSGLWAQQASTAPLCSRMTCIEMILNLSGFIRVVMAEWLRRWTRNPFGSPRAGSNPADYVELKVSFLFFCELK